MGEPQTRSLKLKRLGSDRSAAASDAGAGARPGRPRRRLLDGLVDQAVDIAEAVQQSRNHHLAGQRLLRQLPEGKDKEQWRGRAIDSALRFADRFPDQPQTVAVLAKASQDLLALQQPDRAVATARRVLERVQRISKRYGTDMSIEDNVGLVRG